MKGIFAGLLFVLGLTSLSACGFGGQRNPTLDSDERLERSGTQDNQYRNEKNQKDDDDDDDDDRKENRKNSKGDRDKDDDDDD